MTAEKAIAQSTTGKSKKKKNYKAKYTVKIVYHLNKDTLRKLEKIAFRTSRSYSAIMCEQAEKFVSHFEAKHGEIKL